MKRAWLAATAALTLALAAGPAARASTLVDFTGPTAEMASPDSITFTFAAADGAGVADFTIDGFLSLDGIVSNNLEDHFILSVNGADILSGTWDLGGGGGSQVFFAPTGASIDAHTNGFFKGGVVKITTPVALTQGQNAIRFAFSSAKPEGLGNEGWDLRDFTLTGKAATPEPGIWIMLMMGFFGMGDTLRRSRRRALP